MTKHEMEYEIFNMSYEEMCKYIFKKNMDKEIKSERRNYMSDAISNEKIAEYLMYQKCSLEEIISGINKFKQDCANKFEIGEVVKVLQIEGRLGIIVGIPQDNFNKYKVLEYNNNTYGNNYKFETKEYKASALAAFNKRKIYKDIKQIVEIGKIDND